MILTPSLDVDCLIQIHLEPFQASHNFDRSIGSAEAPTNLLPGTVMEEHMVDPRASAPSMGINP